WERARISKSDFSSIRSWLCAGRPNLIRSRLAARVWRFWDWPISSITCVGRVRTNSNSTARCEEYSRQRSWNRHRKGDGMPGWITLWQGWQLLQNLVEGVLIARKLTNSG